MATKKEKKVVDLTLLTKKQMKELETLKGSLYRVGEYEFRFTEKGLEATKPRYQKTHTRIATTKGGKAKCNIDAEETAHVYMDILPEEYNASGVELAERIFELAGELASDVSKIDLSPLLSAMRAFWKELREAQKKAKK